MPFADDTTPRARYSAHKRNAHARGIPFELTFEEWWGLWERQWASRGKGAGKLVMARRGDCGAYAVGNVFIATQEENSSQKQACRGSDTHQAKLNEQDISRVRDMLRIGEPLTRIGEWFGVTRNAITQVRDGRSWRHA